MGGGPSSAGWVYLASQILILWSGTHFSRFDPSSSASREWSEREGQHRGILIHSFSSVVRVLPPLRNNVRPGKALGKVSWPAWFSDPCFRGNLIQNPNMENKHQEPLNSPAMCESGLSVRLPIWGEKKPGALIAILEYPASEFMAILGRAFQWAPQSRAAGL